MAEPISEQSVESALESAFGNAPAPQKVPAKETAPAPAQDAPVDEPAAEAAPVEEAEAEPVEAAEAEPAPEPEPEFEIEVNGARELVRGKDQIRELLQKGRDYSQKTEAVARARDSIIAQAQQQAMAAQFQGQAWEDITAIRALDSRLDEYNKVDWATAFDTDPFNALKLKEQRDQLREQRNAKVAEFQAKRQQFEAGQAQAAQQRLAAEQSALLNKLPEWRNTEQATKEQREIANTLAQSYGFNEAEIAGLVDHRMVMVARDAMKYRMLQANKTAKVQQVRTAPPVIKPGAQQDKGKVEARSDLKQFREAGRKGEHRTQEQLLEKMLGRAFK